MNWIDQAIQAYADFVMQNTKAKPIDGGWYAIQTTFLNVFNDFIEIYCKNENGLIILSDDGETLNNLNLLGVKLFRSKKRNVMAQQILLNYGVHIANQTDLQIKTDMGHFAQAKHNLISCIMALSDMSVLVKPSASSEFNEDVWNYFNEQEIIATPAFIAKGRSGLELSFAFQIATQKKEILINTFNSLNVTNLSSFLFAWNDIRDARREVTRKDVCGLAFINDADDKKPIAQKYLDAMREKETEYILFSKRNTKENIQKLKAA